MANYSIGPYQGDRGPYVIIGDAKAQARSNSIKAELDAADGIEDPVYIKEVQRPHNYQQSTYDGVGYGHQQNWRQFERKEPQIQTGGGGGPNYCFNCGHSYREQQNIARQQTANKTFAASYRYQPQVEYDAVDESRGQIPPTTTYYRTKQQQSMTEVTRNANQNSMGNFSIGTYDFDRRDSDVWIEGSKKPKGDKKKKKKKAKKQQREAETKNYYGQPNYYNNVNRGSLSNFSIGRYKVREHRDIEVMN